MPWYQHRGTSDRALRPVNCLRCGTVRGAVWEIEDNFDQMVNWLCFSLNDYGNRLSGHVSSGCLDIEYGMLCEQSLAYIFC